MPPKRRGAQAKVAPAPKAAPPDPPKPSLSSKPVAVPTFAPALAPIPPPPPPPSQPVDTGAAKVRKEWSKFIDAWYEPRRKKLIEKLQRDLQVKYQNLGPPKDTQKLREIELFEKLDSIALQLAQPARVEWERRLELAQLREHQWDDMSGEEQQVVMSVFVGFFADDVEDMEDDDISADLSSIEEESIIEEPQYKPSYPASFLASSSKQPIPPTPIRGNFEFVNPTSFFADTMTPLNPTKNLPALSMDHLATLGPSNVGRSAEPVSANMGAFSFQNWASEAGTTMQQPPGQSAKPPSATAAPSLPAATFTQTLSAHPRATDSISRQVSTASNIPSPPFKTTSPQYSPPNPSTKFSPPTNTESLPLGKRYIGPTIAEEEPDHLDEELLRSKMADEYQQYKVSLRIQMIYQFHAEAAEVEIKLFETLLAGHGTKESRARAVQEHETNMVHLREQKEEERKKLCGEERERRREELRQHLTQRRSGAQNQVDPGVRANPFKPEPDKMPVQERHSKVTHQKENIYISQPAVAPSPILEPPSMIKKSNSTLSQGEASANESIFANAMAMMAQGKPGAAVLTSTQASLNEAVFSNAAAAFATQGQPGNSGKTTLQPPSIMKKSNSSRSQEHDIPHITVSFAKSPAAPTPEPAQVLPTASKGKKGKKGQAGAQLPPTKPVVIVQEPEMDVEPPPPAPSLWDTATGIADSAWGAVSSSTPLPTSKFSATVEEEVDFDFIPKTVPTPPKANVNSKKSTPVGKKGKKVTITEEPDVDADPIISPPPSSKPKATKGAWGSVNDKPKFTPPMVEECEPEPIPPPPVMPMWGKKTVPPITKPALKPQLKVAISEEQEGEFWTPAPTPARAKSARGVSAVTPSVTTSSQSSRKAKVTQQQAEPRRGSTPKSAQVEAVPDPEDYWPEAATGDNTMPRMQFAGSEDANEEEEEGDANAWFEPENINYWANFMGGQSEAEPEAQAIPRATEQAGKHVRWTPTVGGESDEEEEFEEEDDDELATNVWMQYAISGEDVPALGGAAEQSQFMPSESTRGEEGRGKKMNPPTDDFGNRAQQTSVFDRAALTGQWPKMESWLSPPSRGQSSGSTRVF